MTPGWSVPQYTPCNGAVQADDAGLSFSFAPCPERDKTSMWFLTSGADPRCRYFLNGDALTMIGHMSGQAFLDAIQPDVIQGIAPDSTVLFGRKAGVDRPQFLLVFRDDERSRKLAATQEAVRKALYEGAGVLDLEELGQALMRM
jgi:hypothetical protein